MHPEQTLESTISWVVDGHVPYDTSRFACLRITTAEGSPLVVAIIPGPEPHGLSPRDFYLPQCLVVASPDGQQIFQEMLVADLLPDSLVVRLIERFGLPDEATIQCHRGVQSPAEGVVVEEGTLSVVNLLVEMNDTLCTVHEANKSATSKDEDVSSHLQTFLTLLLEFTASEPERQES